MTVTLNLTAEQEKRLDLVAKARGLEKQAILHEMIDQALAQETVVEPEPRERIAGLFAGKMHMAEDFDAPLPDSFWLGEE
ncbi:hypothetical protein CCAX7_12980 [Capsulimonas corticalis]|uniref:Uncharacterized protein n=1 Tax=Capsulimonas corticalis TaxID=2219043 RepID=A0A402D4W7_9BACT|nr:CopG family transcriptional regulator [Capsulimonas corticalis]BDI29247.1 hypothetical protein CCAX7_12980 [Capsulimonas corticalis]